MLTAFLILVVGVLVLWALLYIVDLLPFAGDQRVRNVLKILVLLFFILWLLHGFGVFGSPAYIRFG